MSTKRMLIDASHPEETRVVIADGHRLEEFDVESESRKQLKGNIYLAKVTRVEPSLQACFVDYGGNRHGFLAFNEIHPDYYQIPMADRQALLEEEAAAEAEEEAAVDAHAEALERRRAKSRRRSRKKSNGDNAESGNEEELAAADDLVPESDEDDDHDSDDHVEELDAEVDGEGEGDDTDGSGPAPTSIAESTLVADDRLTQELDAATDDEPQAANENVAGAAEAEASEAEAGDSETEANGATAEVDPVDQVGSGEDALEELPARPRRRPRSYKIQEVIKRRQVILVQVVKEERGNKGAALTTYLSLAGRYTVLMPNTARGGGISRKITNPQDRKRLKAIAADLEVPEGMGLIIRTAGAARTKQEIKRDFEYLLRLWESVRDLTLESQAPSLVYEEGNLIKRSIRDLYNKDVDEVIVAGNEAHREAKDFMRMLMPSHAKNVVLYQEPEPLFTRFQIERQLNAMFSPYVTLRSGGYLVINQTEALVAIDVNSGKATREFSIEETALNTNLEAADEIARQLKLRDLAGLIVIDFIDMEEKRNNRAVERRLKEALRLDRARIQVGRISHFGLMEMSRQRLRTGVLEGSTSQCQHCQGTGIIRSTESVALAVLRGLEDAIMAGTRAPLVATTTPSVALYILNNKRPFVNDMEARHGLPITITGSDKFAGANFSIEKGAAPALPQRRTDRAAVNMDWGFDGEQEGAPEGEPVRAVEGGSEEPRRRRRRRRRGGRRGDRPEGNEASEDLQAHESAMSDGDDAGSDEAEGETVEAAGEDTPRGEERSGQRSRRRGRRGGRRGRGRQNRADAEAAAAGGEQPEVERIETDVSDEQPSVEHIHPEFNGEPVISDNREQPEPEEADAKPPSPEPAMAAPEPVADDGPVAPAGEEDVATKESPAPKRSRARAGASEPRIERIVVNQDKNEGAEADTAEEEGTTAPVRKGWWQRRLGG